MNLVSNITRSAGDPKVLKTGPSSLTGWDRLARNLGWFGIGLGIAELFASRRMARSLGMRGQEGLLRAYGAREIMSGILSLSIDRHVGLWSRVAGDVLDIATLRRAMRRPNPRRDNVGLALAIVLGVTVLDILVAKSLSASRARNSRQWRDYSDRSGFPRGRQLQSQPQVPAAAGR